MVAHSRFLRYVSGLGYSDPDTVYIAEKVRRATDAIPDLCRACWDIGMEDREPILREGASWWQWGLPATQVPRKLR